MGEVVALDDSRPPLERRPLITEVQKVALEVIDGGATYEQFDLVDDFVQQRAPKFWRLDTGTALIPYPDKDEYRVDILNATLRRVPVSEEESQRFANWRKKTSVAAIDRMMQSTVKIDSSTTTKAIDVFDNPYVNHALMRQLSEEGYPPFVIIEKYEQWRVEYAREHHEAIAHEDVERGYRAFELFLFGSGGSYFSKKLREIAKIQYLYID